MALTKPWPARRNHLRPMAVAASTLAINAATAWLVLAGVVLGSFADVAAPATFVVRPLIIATLLALLIATISLAFNRHSRLGAGALAFLLAQPSLPVALGVALVLFLVTFLANRGRSVPTATTALVLAGAFFVVGAVSALGTIHAGPSRVPPSVESGPSVYLILVDGYPRSDTLASDLGIDVAGFANALETRGFVFDDRATSERDWTELTLQSFLSGSIEGISQAAFSIEEKRAVRQALDAADLPRRIEEAGYEFVVIDSPVGHVTFSYGRHIRHGGVTDFEASLLGASALEPLRHLAPTFLTDSLRSHLESSLESMVSLANDGRKRVVFAHLLAPHLPFVFDAIPRDPSYWPAADLFASWTEAIGMPMTEYRERMQTQLSALNHRLASAFDLLLEADPAATIVLFSDHGARFSIEQRDEWRRTLLAIRTPDGSRLLPEGATPSRILCAVVEQVAHTACR